MYPPRRPIYYSPTRSVEVGLDDFTIDELQEELVNRTNAADSPFATCHLHLIGEDLASLQTLALCGQRQAALDFLLTELERQTGVKL